MTEPVVLLIVLAGSVLGVALIVMLNRAIGGWSPAVVAGEDGARRALEADVIDFEAGEGAVDVEGRSALFTETGGHRLGLVVARGDGLIARALGPGDVRQAAIEDATLVLRLNDYTLPRAEVTLDDIAPAETWAQRARALYPSAAEPEMEGARAD